MKSLYLSIIAILILATSCQDVITLELENTQIKPVIEASITDDSSDFTVAISYSKEFYDSSSPSFSDNANVTIKLENDAEITLNYVNDGIYSTSEIQGERGKEYTLKVEIDGETYEASAMIPITKIPLDSIALIYRSASIFFDEGIYPLLYYNDPEDEENFYRFNITVNGAPYDFNRFLDDEDPDYDNTINLYNDRFTNGGIQDYDLIYRLVSGDVLRVEIQHLDPFTYEYLNTLQGLSNGTGVAPADPISNFGTGALGYFGAYSLDVMEIIVP